MQDIITLIGTKLEDIRTSNYFEQGTHPAAILSEYSEKKRAFYLGKMNGYNIARAVVMGSKPKVKEVRIVNSKVISVEDYSYVTYLRAIKLLNNVLVETKRKINNRNEVQSKRLLGQSIALMDIVSELKRMFFADTAEFATYV